MLRILYKLCQAFVKGCENYSYNQNLNGESGVINCLALEANCKTIFDVGANHGEWSQLANQKFKNASIHAFEIVPETFEILNRNLGGGNEHIKLNKVGLGESTGSISINFDPSRPGQSTIFKPSVAGDFKEVQAKIVKGDEYCAQEGIEEIDFVKIDVEGAEHLVLRGFQSLLEKNAIRVIQFEYGNCNKETHFLLLDFYEYLLRYGYRIGKIFPYGVEFRDYKLEDENFIGPNFLAVRKSEEKLISQLSRFG